MAFVLANYCSRNLKNVRTAISPTIFSQNTYFQDVNQLSHIIPCKKPKFVKAEEAVQCIKSDNVVFASGGAATPNVLLNAMSEHGKSENLKNVTVCHIHTEGPAKYAQPEYCKHFRSLSFFMGSNVRKSIAEGRGDNISIFLSEIPALFYKKIIQPDVALIHVSVPDKHGFCSLGTSVDVIPAAASFSKIIIAQINPNMPRTFGDAIVHESHLDYAVCVDTPLPNHDSKPLSKVEAKIGKLIAENLVENGATLQMGIGNIPDAVLASLHDHKDLGIHSEMFANGVVDLVNAGCVTNDQKKNHRGRMVVSFLIGSKALYDFVDNNPSIEMLKVDYVNNTRVIAQQPKMTAINSCIEVDLTGQVCSDSIGTRFYSGFGGQVDFITGAAQGLDGKGKPIIAMGSVTNKGNSKITPILAPGAGVVTSRAHVHYIVTEYGIASLFGKSMSQRAHALICIAHPDHREYLEMAAFDRLKTRPRP